MLVAIPLGLFAVGIAVDALSLLSPTSSLTIVAFWELVLAIAVGLLTGVVGLVDVLFVPKPPAQKNVDALAAVANGLLVAAFATCVVLRRAEPAFRPTALTLVLEAAAVGVAALVILRGERLLVRLGRVIDLGDRLSFASSAPRLVQSLHERRDGRPVASSPISSLAPLSAGGGS